MFSLACHIVRVSVNCELKLYRTVGEERIVTTTLWDLLAVWNSWYFKVVVRVHLFREILNHVKKPCKHFNNEITTETTAFSIEWNYFKLSFGLQFFYEVLAKNKLLRWIDHFMGCLESWSEMLWRVFFPSAFCEERRLLCVEKIHVIRSLCALRLVKDHHLLRSFWILDEERCRKAPFWWRISDDGRPTGEIKLRGLRFFF